MVGLTRSGDFPGRGRKSSGPEDAFVAKLERAGSRRAGVHRPRHRRRGRGDHRHGHDPERRRGDGSRPRPRGSIFSTDNRLDPTDTLLDSRTVPRAGAGRRGHGDHPAHLADAAAAGQLLPLRQGRRRRRGRRGVREQQPDAAEHRVGTDLTVTVRHRHRLGPHADGDGHDDERGRRLGRPSIDDEVLPGRPGQLRAARCCSAAATSRRSPPAPRARCRPTCRFPRHRRPGSYTVVARADADGGDRGDQRDQQREVDALRGRRRSHRLGPHGARHQRGRRRLHGDAHDPEPAARSPRRPPPPSSSSPPRARSTRRR